jgi:hypothetical protein
MDQEKLNLFAKVKLLSRKSGFDVDLARMMADDDYAARELQLFMASGVPELADLAGKANLKLISANVTAASAPISPVPDATSGTQNAVRLSTEAEPAASEKKYVLGVRG